MNAIDTALQDFRPQIAEQYKRIVRSQFERMVASLGPALKNVVNDWTWARTYSSIKHCVARDFQSASIKEEVLEAAAEKYAELTVEAVRAKILEKLGALDNAEVRRMTGCEFSITGERAGHRVSILQSVIVNVSPKGLPFNQFPARIYVDGKFVSAAAYKKMM